ncbi:MAG: ribose 5-phosphate isomerase B [Anaerolineae bacterium]|nr:ribose 5-phosphate isomerase B [Anaerolineae bacterium]
MKIAVGTDHGGYPLKEAVIQAVQQAGHEVLDLGTHVIERVDYPDFGILVGEAVRSGQADRGIAICGSGVGVSITVNKMKGVYGAVCHDTYTAHQGVEHDNMNVLCLGGRVVGTELAMDIVKAFLGAEFLNTGNYLKRVMMVQGLEARECGQPQGENNE